MGNLEVSCDKINSEGWGKNWGWQIKQEKERSCRGTKIGLISRLKGLSSPLIYVAALGDREREGARGTCSGALAKSPIITSKLDSAGGGLSGTGALWRMNHHTEIGVKKGSSLCQFFPSCVPLPPLTVPHIPSVIHLVLPSLSLPFAPPLLPPPCDLSV